MQSAPIESLFVGQSELASLMRDTNWAATPMGPVDSWPQSVRAIVRMMLTSRYAMWMGWGPDLRFFYNDAYAQMTLGSKHPWALGRPAQEVWSEIWPDVGPRIDHVLTTGEATWDEGLLLFLERSGFPEETYHTFSYSPLHDDRGQISGMFCVVTEETTRIIGERRLALLRELAAQLSSSEQTTENVWAALHQSLTSDARDLPFTLTYLHDGASDQMQLVATTNIVRDGSTVPQHLALDDSAWPVRQILEGDRPSAVVPLSQATAWPTGPWDKAAANAIVVPIPQQAQSRPAGVFIAGLNPYRPFDREYESFIKLYVGQLAAGLANAQAYAAERRRAEALAQIDRAKTMFFSNVSHELRTPLTLMLGPVADALASGGGSLPGDALELVHRNGLRLRKLVNTLLDFSRIEAGRVEASYTPVDLAAYTAELASAFESVTDRAGLRLVIDTTPGGDPAYVDRDMWEKIVFNLVSNAFKFTFEGEIAVSVVRHGQHMQLSVRDTGTGIPSHELPRIFDRFHRVEGARGRTHEGTGIGLALVSELVKLHGGTIEVQSELGTGTTFTVDLPLGTAHLPAERIARERTLTATSVGVETFVNEAARWLPEATGLLVEDLASESTDMGPLESGHVLLADDNADMRAYLRHLLGVRWHVEEARDGLEALQRAHERRPDVILTDVMMPNLDGFGLLKALRADPALRDVPVMMLSARAGEESRVEGFEAGADDYVVKPFTARELVARVHAQLLRARVRAVEADQRRRLAQVFMHAPVAIAILRGPTHVFDVANPPYLELVARPDVVGRPVREALPELEGQGVFEALDRVYHTGERFVGRSAPVKVQRRGILQECFFDLVYQPLLDDDQRVEGIAVVAFEVTELASARQAAEAANRAKDEFLAMLGHELRNPLAPIVTALQLLRLRGVQGAERERAVIERQVRHLIGLVDDLLDVSRITRGKVRLKREPIELHDVLVKATELASPLLEQHHHDLTVNVPKEGLVVLADSARLAQVISNLLTNAAKYTPPGGHISVDAFTEGQEVVVRVADTGIGIDPAMLPRIFDLFTQERQAIDRAEGGLGLGLAIVRSLVALHDGSVEAHSEGRGRGSEFVLRLPRADTTAVDGHERVPGRDFASAPLATRRVLVVDDNEDAATMLVELLKSAGHHVVAAHDGPTALVLAESFRPEVALLDIGLPVMDGFELARQFRATPALRGTRLIAVTGYGQEHDRRASADAGFDAHLVKPVDIDDLQRLVQPPPDTRH
jgi:signal transduction histidine kinase/CheY-like chemotaxis protein